MDKILFVYFAIIISCIDLKTYRIPDSVLVMFLLLKTCIDIRVGDGYMLLNWDIKRKLPFAPFMSAGAIVSLIVK